MFLFSYPLMPSKLVHLKSTMDGFDLTGIPLIMKEHGQFLPTSATDDVGMYVFIPMIARALHLTVERAASVFFLGMMVVLVAIGIVGCLMWLKRPWMKAFAIAAILLLAWISLEPGDTYPVSTWLTIAIVPFLMYFTKQEKLGWPFFLFLFLSGLAMGIGYFIRGHSGTTVLILMTGLILSMRKINWKRKVAAFAILAVFIYVPSLYFNGLVRQRDTWLLKSTPGYVATGGHIIWHSIYLGFGYLPNNYGLTYTDEVAYAKARSIDPSVKYWSAEYKSIIRAEVFKLVRDDPGFVLKTIFTKMLYCLIALVKYMNIGIIATLFRRKPLAVELSFWIAIVAGSAFGILVMPWLSYLQPMVSMCVMYAIVSVDYAVEHFRRK